MIGLDSEEYFKYSTDSDSVYFRKISTENLPEELWFNEKYLTKYYLESISSNRPDEENPPQENDTSEESCYKKEIPEEKPIGDSPGEQVPLD